MFIPLYDRNKISHIKFQWVTLIIIVVNIVIWLVMELSGQTAEISDAVIVGLGYIPSVANDIKFLPQEMALVPEWSTYVSYSFVHGGFMHLAGNMLFLWIFGDNVEDALGHFRFIIFYGLCAAAGALVHGMVVPSSDGPLIGASGAASGVVSAYLLLHPRVRVWILLLGRIPMPLPSYIALTLWIIFQFFMFFSDVDGEISWGAHIGGIVAGAILIVFMKRKGVKLFAKPELTDGAGEPEVENARRFGRPD